jgi:DNA-binding protein H-NS
MSLENNKKHGNLDSTLALIAKLNELGHDSLSVDEFYQLVLGFLEIVLFKEAESRFFKEKVIETLANSLGCGVDFTSLPRNNPNQKVKMPPKYRNPKNYHETWVGRGIKPVWVKEHLAAGGIMEDLNIGK